jgi:hypothetical protein
VTRSRPASSGGAEAACPGNAFPPPPLVPRVPGAPAARAGAARSTATGTFPGTGARTRAQRVALRLSSLPLRQDYIERVIQRLAEAIARALGVAKAGQPEEGIAIIDDAIAAGFGLPVPMLLGLTPQTVWSLLGPDKARSFAEALRARATLLAGAGRADERTRCENLAAALDRLRGAR